MTDQLATATQPRTELTRAEIAGTRAVVVNILRSVARRADEYHALEGVAQRIDGWANVLTGFGNKLVDKTSNMVPTVFRRLSDNVLVSLFHGDPTARKACEARPTAALAEGITFTLPKDKGGAELSTKMLDEHERLDSVNKVVLACTWEALFGGAAIWVGLDDGHYDIDSQARPVDMASIERVLFLKELDRRQIVPDYSSASIDDDPMSPTFGEPDSFLVDGGNGVFARVHRSRLIVFPGIATTYELRRNWNGWGVSALDVAWQALQRNAMVWASSANAVGNAQYVIYKIKGLAHMLLADDGEAKTKKRAAAMEMAKSMLNAILIDAEDDYIRENPDFGNLPEMIDRSTASCTTWRMPNDMPVTELFGRSPAGMNATGESDREMWHGSLNRYRRHRLRMRFHKISEFIIAAKQGPFRGVDPGGWSIGFPPLKQLTGTEKAEVRLKTSQADKLDIESEVVTPNEIALSRFRAEGYSTETTIDIEMREQHAKLDKERAEAEMKAQIEEAKARAENPMGPPKGGDEGGGGADKPSTAKKSKET